MKRSNRIGSRIFIGLTFLFLYLPIFLLIIFSFNAGDSSAVWKGFSLDWYAALFQNRLIMESLYTTLLVSLLATVISTAAGTFAAIGLYSLGRKKRDALLVVNDIPMMNADIVTGVSLCLFFVAFFQGWGTFARWFNGVQSAVELPVRLTLGFGTMLLAHIAFNIPYVILNVAPKLRQMDKNLVDAAQDLGCTWMQAFWKVILPEIKPGIVSGALIAFTMSVDDFVISYFTAGSATSTLAMTIYGMTKRRITPEINAVYTHMLGHDCHSIVAGAGHADGMIAQLKAYIKRGYDLILTSHYTPEDLKDAQTKIDYLERLKAIAAACRDAGDFKAEVKKAYPAYGGGNYLDMTAGFFFG